MIVNGELKRKEDVVLAILRKQNSDKWPTGEPKLHATILLNIVLDHAASLKH
jgi:hypothetical protein